LENHSVPTVCLAFLWELFLAVNCKIVFATPIVGKMVSSISGQSVLSHGPKPEGMSCRIGFPSSTKGILRAEVRGGKWGQSGRFRIILPETVGEFEHRSSDVRKTLRLSSRFPGSVPQVRLSLGFRSSVSLSSSSAQSRHSSSRPSSLARLRPPFRRATWGRSGPVW
jgi:hypothetical protein